MERADDDFDANAVEKVNEVENARISIEKSEINYGFYTTMIIITDKNEELAEDYIDTIGDIFLPWDLNIKAKI